MQVDHACLYIGLHAFHSFSVLSEILYDDSRRIVRRIGRWATLVRKMHLLDRSGGSLFDYFGYSRGRSCHEILRSLLYVLPNGASMGKSYIFSRWVLVSLLRGLKVHVRECAPSLKLEVWTCSKQLTTYNICTLFTFVFRADNISFASIDIDDVRLWYKNELIAARAAMFYGVCKIEAPPLRIRANFIPINICEYLNTFDVRMLQIRRIR